MNNTPYKSIFNFFWSAKTKYSLHSPFVFDFFNKVMNKNVDDNNVNDIELYRTKFLNNRNKIDFVEYGAGSKTVNGNSRKISSVAKSSLSGKWQCGLIYNMIQRYKPSCILEIGTSLGVSTAYMGVALLDAEIITLEGNPSSAKIAEQLFKDLDCNQIELVLGEFDNTLDIGLNKLKTVDCAFIDGNHRKDATINYFHRIRPYLDKGSFVIVDDIYWSRGMHEAWNEIINHKSVAFSIDVFRMGIVFFDHSIMEKQHFKLIEAKWKLWSIGVFG